MLVPAAGMEFPLQRRCGPQVKLLGQVSSEGSGVSLSGCAGGCLPAEEQHSTSLQLSPTVMWCTGRGLCLYSQHIQCVSAGEETALSACALPSPAE